ncbi:hypothetical protein LJC68_02070 [Bacteroidales bacterium OttesenSCG-928-B11]|nr:hypothetical protein [Bacteroidales bacterium OttesenSCG-928-C03]MDL2311647.1 hypothetical protein [Bacteroidales bacterium OttesenSCG-928-B11]
MKKLLLLLIVGILFASCKCFYYTTPVVVKKEFTYKYDGKETGIDSLLNIKGYYVVNYYETNNKNDTILRSNTLLFFKDGTFTYNICNYTCHNRCNENIPVFFNDIYQDDSLGIANDFYENRIWGRYLIFGDTVKVQSIIRPVLYSSDPSWHGLEIWYKVIDINSLEEIFAKPIGVREYEKTHYYNSRENRSTTQPVGSFHPTTVLPSSNGWIKSKKWFWENKTDWRNYKKSLKNNREKKR